MPLKRCRLFCIEGANGPNFWLNQNAWFFFVVNLSQNSFASALLPGYCTHPLGCEGSLQADLDQLIAHSAKDRAALHKCVVIELNVQILQPLLSFLPYNCSIVSWEVESG